MQHVIEYKGERKTVEAKRTASVLEVLEIAFPGVWPFDFTQVVCHGAATTKREKVK